MSTLPMKKADGGAGASVELPDDYLRHRAERRRDAPSRDRGARREACRYAQHEDACEVRGGGAKPWRKKGTARAPRFDPCAAVARRWCGPRPAPARLLAEDTQEDGPPRRRTRPPIAPPRARSSSSMTGASTAPSTKSGVNSSCRSACATRGRRPSRRPTVRRPGRITAACSAIRVLLVLFRTEEAVWKSVRNLGERVQVLLPEELNTYDVLLQRLGRVLAGVARRERSHVLPMVLPSTIFPQLRRGAS